MTRILCIGLNPAIDMSCDAPRVQPTLKVRTRNPMQHPGGGGVNVARVLAELGATPDLAFLSGGATGGLFEEMIEAYPIRRHRFPMAAGVRIAFMVHETETSFEYRFVPEGPIVGADELEPVLRFCESFGSDWVVASGSLPRGAPPETYARLAVAANRNGARFVLDTSGQALAETLAGGGVFLVKPSIGELEKLVGRRLDEKGAAEAASDLVRTGRADNVAVSMGQSGALLVNADGVLRLPAVRVKVRSAVGAGDSFLAGMVWALSQGRRMPEAFSYGVAAGAATAMTTGTELCRRADVEALHATIPA